ncbi:MAG: helix-turn-helix transcriptional regulator, partial [Desulfobulbaceae bacterium]|nr:helix-turn-helix transcriptional regulator [Desulfobulbaceae bacterium]
ETNIALTVLLKKRIDDKRELEHHITANVRTLVEPYLAKLGKGRLTAEQKVLVDILESNLDGIISPFTSTLSSKFVKLTPAEIQVANLVKQGKRTKDIAELLNLSPGTINIHRKNIRKKLGLTNQGGNLQSVLSSFA